MLTTPGDRDEEEVAVVRRTTQGKSTALWEEILKCQGATAEGKKRDVTQMDNDDDLPDPMGLVRSSSTSKPTPKLKPSIAAAGPSSTVSRIQMVRSSSIVSPIDTPPLRGPSAPRPFRRPSLPASSVIDADSVSSVASPGAGTSTDVGKNKEFVKGSNGFLSGVKIRAMGEARSAALIDAVRTNGGVVLDVNDDADADFIIVRLGR